MNFFRRWLHNFEIGESGERIAARHLKKLGYTIVETNWRSAHTEIDIIAVLKKERELHIVEVKSRTTESWEAVGASLTAQKVAALRRGAVKYSTTNSKYSDYTLIFDVVAVFFNEGKNPKIEFVRDIRF